jgi:hypothetical protein
VFGGAVAVLGVDDGKDPAQPLTPEAGQRFDWIDILDRRDIEPADPSLGATRVQRSELFRFVGAEARDARLIHRSRLIFFPGAVTTRTQKLRNAGWDDSVLQVVYNALRDFQNDLQSVSALMSDASQGVFKIKGLMKMLAAQRSADIEERISLIDLSRSVARAIVLDSDGESFERVSTSFAGLPDMVDRGMQHVAAVADVPASILFGRQPAGLNATGESDVRGWYDTCDAWRERRARKPFERLVDVMLALEGAPDAKYNLTFGTMWSRSLEEDLTARKTQAEIDALYMDRGVYDSVEVADSRFRSTGWSHETTLQDNGRAQMVAADQDPSAAPTTEPAEVIAGTPGTADPKPAAAAFNGAQVTSLETLAKGVSEGTYPVETAIAIAIVAFPITREQASEIFSPIKVKEPAPANATPGNETPPPSNAPPPPTDKGASSEGPEDDPG